MCLDTREDSVGQAIRPSQRTLPPQTTQHRKTKTNVHDLSGIRTHDLSVQAIKAFASDRAAAGTDTTKIQSIICKSVV
jgi:hypothetical protein